MRIGFALGGGGALSLSFLPILQTLHEHNIRPAIISGVSMGAVIGCFYALYKQPQKVEEKIIEYLESPPLKNLEMLSHKSLSQEK